MSAAFSSIAFQTSLLIRAAEETHAAGGGESLQIPELPNFIHVLHHYFPDNGFVNFLYRFELQIFVILVVITIGVLFRLATKNISIIPGRVQSFVELCIESLYSVVCGILGEKEGRRYFPFLGSLFIFIFFMNWFGLFPLMKSPTSSILVTAALAICVFFFVQGVAIQRLGVKTYFYHLMGEPKDAVGWGLVVLFLPLHIMEEFIKPLSLACRLYGNIFGEDMLLGIMMILGVTLSTAVVFWPDMLGIPFHLPFVLLAMLLSTIQALVFTLLATVYISMVLPHENHQEEHGAH